MNIQSQKLSIIEWLLKLQDEKILHQIDNIRMGTDFWDELSEEEKSDINMGIDELDRGEKHNYQDFISEHRRKK